jgi:hypothetical protein
MRKIVMAFGIVLAVLAGAGASSAASRPAPVAKIVKPVFGYKISHPCDFGRDGRIGGVVERLCMTVWVHDAYTITYRDGSMTETPAGPVVVVELVNAAKLEGGGVGYIREGLANEVREYAKRDK